MITFENTEIMNFEGAIRGMRNPLNSWDKSDSCYCGEMDDCIQCYFLGRKCKEQSYILGPNDLNLAQRLIKAGPDHRKFMRQIFVSVDITAPLYWWKEFDTYKVGTVANSCSTMHTIHKKPFTREDFSIEHLLPGPLELLDEVIDMLNHNRMIYLDCKDKVIWWQIIQLLPTSYNQRRTVTLNYETLYNIYGSRRNHKLDEWSIGFMNWIESLPYAKELIVEGR